MRQIALCLTVKDFILLGGHVHFDTLSYYMLAVRFRSKC